MEVPMFRQILGPPTIEVMIVFKQEDKILLCSRRRKEEWGFFRATCTTVMKPHELAQLNTHRTFNLLIKGARFEEVFDYPSEHHVYVFRVDVSEREADCLREHGSRRRLAVESFPKGQLVPGTFKFDRPTL